MITIRFFAALRELVGRAEMDWEWPRGAPVRDLLAQLKERFPELERYEPVLLVAVNHEYAAREAAVSPGDEVAFFPPVSGG